MSAFKNKTVLVTGASRGIGEATARQFSSLGANVVLCARTAKDITRIASEISADDKSGNACALVCDVANYEAVKNTVVKTVSEFGAVDILVNNAGVIEPIARMEDSNPGAWSDAFDINLKGVYNTMHAAFVELQKSSGVIVNISSGAATSALEGWSHYCSSKAAALMLTRCAHEEWAGLGIRTVGLSPGTVATQMQVDIKNSGLNVVSTLDWETHIPPEWVADAIVWLSSDEARRYDGTDVSLREPAIREAVGLPV